ncbi:hypothetical protein T11_13884 [Trichinella zimbabwensis]|uniref:Uncharacterized protein n=1 Tax=Trichinella zimbabwensis TaxID=268475 RepID=A0A0V1H6L4_9BILA|nr:hypothetical protein T11_13884 [Trichinella zimbabwensis]
MENEKQICEILIIACLIAASPKFEITMKMIHTDKPNALFLSLVELQLVKSYSICQISSFLNFTSLERIDKQVDLPIRMSLNYNTLRNFEYVCMQLNQPLNYANSFNYGQMTKCVDWKSELTGRGVRPSAVLLGSLVNE